MELYEHFQLGYEKAYNFWEGDCTMIIDSTRWSNEQKSAYLEGYEQYMSEHPSLKRAGY